MFSVKDLMKLKELTKRNLESDLRINKAIYDGIGGTDFDLYINPALLQKQTKEVGFEKGKVHDLDLLGDLTIIPPNAIDFTVTVDGRVKQAYSNSRHDIFSKVIFTASWFEPMAEVPEHLVRYETKTALTKRFMPEGMNKYNFTIDCRLMEQFKLEHITMAQVIEGSIGECQI